MAIKCIKARNNFLCILTNKQTDVFLRQLFFHDILSNFWLQPWMNRWFVENQELPTQASMLSVQLIFFISMLS